MITSIYEQISKIKHTKHDKLLKLIRKKVAEIDNLSEKKRLLDLELDDLLKEFPARKKEIYDEYLEDKVSKNTFEKIGYKIMVLEHEISAHRLKITSQEALIDTAQKELEELNIKRTGLSRTLEKYNILIENDMQENKKLSELAEDIEMEEFSRSNKGRDFFGGSRD